MRLEHARLLALLERGEARYRMRWPSERNFIAGSRHQSCYPALILDRLKWRVHKAKFSGQLLHLCCWPVHISEVCRIRLFSETGLRLPDDLEELSQLYEVRAVELASIAGDSEGTERAVRVWLDIADRLGLDAGGFGCSSSFH